MATHRTPSRWNGVTLAALIGSSVLAIAVAPRLADEARPGYVCEHKTYQQTVIEYVLEGPSGWPFARAVGVRD